MRLFTTLYGLQKKNTPNPPPAFYFFKGCLLSRHQHHQHHPQYPQQQQQQQVQNKDHHHGRQRCVWGGGAAPSRTSNSGPSIVCFVHYDEGMCPWPKLCAIFYVVFGQRSGSNNFFDLARNAEIRSRWSFRVAYFFHPEKICG